MEQGQAGSGETGAATGGFDTCDAFGADGRLAPPVLGLELVGRSLPGPTLGDVLGGGGDDGTLLVFLRHLG